MKEHIQLSGTKSWYGDQLLELQHENLTAIQAFFKEYGACIINGCEVTVAASSGGVPTSWNIAAGLVALNHADGFKVCRFAGATGVDFASDIYLYCTKTTVNGRYKGGATNAVAYTYAAVHATGAPPVANDPRYLVLNPTATEVYTTRFVDAVRSKSLGGWETLTLTGTGVAGSLKCRLDRISRTLQIQGSITLSSFGGASIRQIIQQNAGTFNYWPIGYEPLVRQYFKAHRHYDPNDSSYIKEITGADFLTDLDCYADEDGLSIIVKAPASGSSYTVKINAIVQVD